MGAERSCPLELPSLSHVGIVVSDLAVAAADFKRRWGASIEDVRELTLSEALYHDRPVEISSLRGFIRSGNSDLEVIQPLSTPSPYADFLKRGNSDGVHHLAYAVHDIDDYLSRLQPTRSELALDAFLPGGGGRVVYLEGFAHGPAIELIEVGEWS